MADYRFSWTNVNFTFCTSYSNCHFYHIYHKENDRSKLKENDEFLANVIKAGKMRAEKGLSQYE